MSVRFYEGWITLCGQFPPSLNKEDDNTTLKPFESPDAYGADPTKDGFLKTGSAPASDTRTVLTNSFRSEEDNVAKSWEWFYNRSWYDTGKTLNFTAPEYDDADHRQGLGKIRVDTGITTFMPALGSSMWVPTPRGSHFIANVTDQRGFYSLDEFKPELAADSAASCLTLDQIPYVCNAEGVFSYDGRTVKEWTRPVRASLGSFASRAIKVDYQKKYLVGGTVFTIDTSNGKLFDFGTSGFRFTSRTLAQADGYGPFTVGDLRFVYEIDSSTRTQGRISWETKLEDGSWRTEDDIVINDIAEKRTAQTVQMRGRERTAHKFAMRITALSSNIYIREIKVSVAGLAAGSASE